MRVYALKFNKEGIPCKGFLTDIENELSAIQKFVGGYYQMVPLMPGIAVICNEDGKLKKFPPNRAWISGTHIRDIFVGDMFVCRTNGADFSDILEVDISIIENILIPIDSIIDNQVLCRPADTLPEYKEA